MITVADSLGCGRDHCIWAVDQHPVWGAILRCLGCEKQTPFTAMVDADNVATVKRIERERAAGLR